MTKSYSIELPYGPGPDASGMGGDTPFDLKALVGTVYRRFWLILLGFLTTFALIAYVTFTATPIYTSKTTIQLDTNQENVIDLGSVLGGLAANTAVVDTEVLVVGSKSLLTKVAIKQKLIEEPEFNWTLREKKPSLIGGLKKSVLGALGRSTEDPDPYEGLTPEARQAAILESVVSTLTHKTNVKRVGTTYLITVEVTSESAEMSARLSDAIADQYRVQQLEQKLEATRRATQWLQERVTDLRDEVEEKARRVEQFRAQYGLLSSQGATLTEQNISSMTMQKTLAEAEYNRVRARYESMRQQQEAGDIDSMGEVLQSVTIGRLKEQRAMVARRVADLETKLGSQHPELIGARNELADIDARIRSEVNSTASSLQAEMRAKQREINGFQSDINRLNGELRGNNQALVQLAELERDAETSRVLYEEFLSRAKETGQQDELVKADANILATASIPSSPSSPKTMLNLVIGALLGGIIGGALALLAEMFDMKISSSEDVERKLGANAIGSVPMIRGGTFLGLGQTSPADFLIDNPLSAYAESIRYLRAAIAFSDLDSETKTVAITSSLPDEGKTSLTLSLGRMSAMSGSRTLVIDGDFRRRQLTEAAGMSPEIGFIEHLFGAGQLSDAITKDRKSMLDILPLSQSGHTPHDVFGTRAFDDLLARLRSMYDLILIDTGPLLLMAEARVVAGKADKTILVVRWRHSTRAAAKQSLALLKNFKANLLGVTLNMVDLNRRRHHRDPGATYKAYRKYYQMDTKKSLFGRSDRMAGAKPNKRSKKPPMTTMPTPPEDRFSERLRNVADAKSDQ